jgi:hypothetical protein
MTNNKRKISWDEGWEIINKTLEGLEDEKDMIPMLTGQLGYVLSTYIKNEYYDTMIFDIMTELRDRLHTEEDEHVRDDCKAELDLADKDPAGTA